MSITLVKVTRANINKLLKLEVSKEQIKYVSPIKDIIKISKNTTEKYNNKPITYWLRAIKYKGYQIGKSLFEENKEDLIETIIKNCKEQNCNLLIPEDTIVSKNHNSMGQLKNIDNIDLDDIILDIGEKTIKKINSIIDQSKTVLWNGPAGYFEVKEFAQGSKQIAKKISENTKNKSLISIAGGGDTAAALNMFNCSQEFTYISTAGGAFLELLEGKILPGIKALEKNE